MALLPICLILCSILYTHCSPIVTTKYGTLEGIVNVANNVTMNSYIGIPYARPITNKDRGMRSSPPVRWKGVRSVQNCAPGCIQSPFVDNTSSISYSEDCLYLDVYTPVHQSDAPLPVLFFIPQSAFRFGTICLHDSQVLASNFVSRDVIVVLAQHRLAALGYASLNSSVITSNLGLWDLTAALQYISENIHSFGGDKDRVTVMGHSAAAMATEALSVSSFSRDLFGRSVQLSASAWMLTSYNQLVPNTKQFFQQLGCTDETSVLECYQNTPIEEICEAQDSLLFTPFVGDDFLPIPPQNLKGPWKPLFTGLATLEGLMRAFFDSDVTVFPFIDRTSVELYLNDTLTPQFGPKSDEAYRRLANYYLNQTIHTSPEFHRQLVKIYSNVEVDIPVLRAVLERIKSGNVFLYHFDYFNEEVFQPTFPVKETFHSHELAYLMEFFRSERFDFNEDDHKVLKFLVDSIAQFIKTGNPSTSSFAWPKSDAQLRHVKVRPEPDIDEGLFWSDYLFWEEMKQLGHDLITATAVEPT